jgi:hypothetical protein
MVPPRKRDKQPATRRRVSTFQERVAGPSHVRRDVTTPQASSTIKALSNKQSADEAVDLWLILYAVGWN